MKNCLLLFFVLLTCNLLSQNKREFIPSKSNKFVDKDAKLLLNAKSTTHFINREVDDFIDAKKVEIKNISDSDLLEKIAKRVLLMRNLEELTFNNCDLFFLNYEFSTLGNLKTLKVLNTSFYNLNDLIYSLKSNPNLTNLTLSTDELFNIPDSLYLLNNLKNFDVINTNSAESKVYRTTLTYTTSNRSVTKLEIAQYGFETSVESIQNNGANLPLLSSTSFAFSNNIINPPIKGIDINDRLYYIKSKQDNTLDYESGSVLYIPKNAFASANGKDYNGDVTVFYREFRDPIDQLLSGIPMTNTEQGTKNIFVSAGMYELWAYDDTKQKLQLKAGKKITIDFKPTTDSGTYNFYALDTANGDWTSSNQSVNLTKSFQMIKESSFEKFLFWRDKYMKIVPDHSKFEDRFNNPNYIGIINIKNFHYYRDSAKFSLEGYNPRLKSKMRVKSKYKITGARINKDGNLVFKYYTRDYYDYGFGQNIRSLEEKQLQLVGHMTKEEFKKKFYKKIFTDVRLIDEGSHLTLKFKSKTGIVDLPFNIIEYNPDKKEFITKTKTERAVAKHFNLRLKVNSKVHDKKNIRLHNSRGYDHIYGAEKDVASKMAYEKIKSLLSEKEKIMSYDTYVKHADSLEIRRKYSGNGTRVDETFNKSLDTIVAKTNSILINSNLGFNNIDCYLHQGLVQDLYVNYVSPQTQENVKTDFTTTIISGINTSINNFALETNNSIRSRYIKGKDFALLRLDSEGYIQVDHFKSNEIKTNGVNLPLANKIYIKGKSSSEIKKLMGL